MIRKTIIFVSLICGFIPVFSQQYIDIEINYEKTDIEYRINLIRNTKGEAIITLCGCPTWMHTPASNGTTEWGSALEKSPTPVHFADFAHPLGLWTSPSNSEGGRPTPFYYSLKILKDHFSKGVEIVNSTTISDDVTAIASKQKILTVNHKNVNSEIRMMH
jgi:hypothetical protein